MEARHELHYLQHGHVNHRASQINGSKMDIYHQPGPLFAWCSLCVKRHGSYCKLCWLFDGNILQLTTFEFKS